MTQRDRRDEAPRLRKTGTAWLVLGVDLAKPKLTWTYDKEGRGQRN